MNKIMLQDRIKKNAKYFRGMEMTNGILIVKVLYEDKWGVYPKEDESVKVAKSTELPNEWYYYGDFDVITFDDVFDLIEETVEMNINAAKKIDLLNQKSTYHNAVEILSYASYYGAETSKVDGVQFTTEQTEAGKLPGGSNGRKGRRIKRSDTSSFRKGISRYEAGKHQKPEIRDGSKGCEEQSTA